MPGDRRDYPKQGLGKHAAGRKRALPLLRLSAALHALLEAAGTKRLSSDCILPFPGEAILPATTAGTGQTFQVPDQHCPAGRARPGFGTDTAQTLCFRVRNHGMTSRRVQPHKNVWLNHPAGRTPYPIDQSANKTRTFVRKDFSRRSGCPLLCVYEDHVLAAVITNP
jgi:hypothetical protein